VLKGNNLSYAARAGRAVKPGFVNAAEPDDTDAAVAATGAIVAVAIASLLDNEAFVLDDGVHAAVTFKFDFDGDGVSGGATPVDLTGLTTAAQVATAMRTAINAKMDLDITAAGSGANVTLTNDTPGAQGNVAITDTVANAGFTHTGMSGGIDAGSAPTAFGDWIEQPWIFGNKLVFIPIFGPFPDATQASVKVQLRKRSDGSAEYMQDVNGVDLRIAAARTVTDGALDDAGGYAEIDVSRIDGQTYSAVRLVIANEDETALAVGAAYVIADPPRKPIGQYDEFAGLIP